MLNSNYIHIIISVGLIILSAVVLTIIVLMRLIDLEQDIELVSTISVIILAISGFIYQSGENTRLQNLDKKREIYANVMEKIFYIEKSEVLPEPTVDEAIKLNELYHRSWIEMSDDVIEKLNLYLDSYQSFSKNRDTENKVSLEEGLNKSRETLTKAMRSEITNTKLVFKYRRFTSFKKI